MRQNSGLSSRAWRAMRATVMKREDRCYLCGKPVDKALPGSYPMGPQVDHVMARSAGGALYSTSNLHLVHAICNQKKGNLSLDEFRYRQAKDSQHSRNW